MTLYEDSLKKAIMRKARGNILLRTGRVITESERQQIKEKAEALDDVQGKRKSWLFRFMK